MVIGEPISGYIGPNGQGEPKRSQIVNSDESRLVPTGNVSVKVNEFTSPRSVM